MIRKTVLFMSLFLLLMSIGVSSAQDLPNWCDAPDGVWYYGDGLSKCNTQPDAWSNAFMWVAGYYGALYDAGDITLDELFAIDPAIAGDIIAVRLPELLITSESGTSGGTGYINLIGVCFLFPEYDFTGQGDFVRSLNFTGTPSQMTENIFSDSNCQNNEDSGFNGWFAAASQAVADTVCNGTAQAYSAPWTTIANVYRCR